MKWNTKETITEGPWLLVKKTVSFNSPKQFFGPYESVTLKQRELLTLYSENYDQPMAELVVLPGFQKITLHEAQELALSHILSKTLPSHWKRWTQSDYEHFFKATLCQISKEGIDDFSRASLSSFMEQIRGYFQDNPSQAESPKESSLISAKDLPELNHKVGVIKIKVHNNQLKETFQDLEGLSEQKPDLYYRLDGNRKLQKTQLEDVYLRASKKLKDRIQYIEEPCSSTKEHLELVDKLPLALDESLRDYQYSQTENFEELKGLITKVKFFVCKPLLHGGPLTTRSIYKHLMELHSPPKGQTEQKLHLIVSHCFEGPVGLKWNKLIAKIFDPHNRDYHGINWKP